MAYFSEAGGWGSRRIDGGFCSVICRFRSERTWGGDFLYASRCVKTGRYKLPFCCTGKKQAEKKHGQFSLAYLNVSNRIVGNKIGQISSVLRLPRKHKSLAQIRRMLSHLNRLLEQRSTKTTQKQPKGNTQHKINTCVHFNKEKRQIYTNYESGDSICFAFDPFNLL